MARYQQIAAYLAGLVAARQPGDRLPSDADLCERFGVSRGTARQAVNQLVTAGSVVRRRGQGTFVAAPRIPRLLGSPLSFTESMRERGLEASSRVLESGAIRPDPAEAAALRIDPAARPVVLERLRLAGGVPMAIERAVITPACAAVLAEDLGTGSLHEAFERLGHRPSVALATVSARRATARERRLLELPASAVVLCERRVISDQDGLPLEHTETRYAAERYEFETVLFRDEQP